MKTLPLLPAVLLCSLVCISPLLAVDGAVHGRVYGQNEKGDNLGPLANARIELKGDAGGAVVTATTNQFGYYQIATLKPGAYRYKVEAAGFKLEDEQRGFAMPQDTREFVHDFLLSQEPKPGASGPAQTHVIQPAVHGRVYGQNGKGDPIGPIPGARIELLSGKGGPVVATATANSPGAYYEVKNLPPADYAYRVSAAGFATEDAGRGFTVPKATLEYVHDFLLSKPPAKRFNCDQPILVVKRLGTSRQKTANDVRMPVPNARIVLQPTTSQQTPLHQPYVTDAKGEHTIPGLPQGRYAVAIDAPECEPFTGVLNVVCDAQKNNDQVIFELEPCNELLHGYVRALLVDGWGPSREAQGASDRAHQRALKADGAKDCRVTYALALAQLSAGNHDAARANLAAAIGQKSDDPAWDRACQTRLWMSLIQHQPAQTIKEIRSLVKNHYATRAETPASRDTARLCGQALGLMKGPWKDIVPPGDVVQLEGELLASLQGHLQTECSQGRDSVLTDHGKRKGALDDARHKLMTDLVAKRDAEVARMLERQKAITTTVATLDKEIIDLQGSVTRCNEQFRVQILGFTQQREALVPQMTALGGRLQQINACMAQDQQNYQGALRAQQTPQMPQPPMIPQQPSITPQQQMQQQQQMQIQQEMIRRQQEEMMRRQQMLQQQQQQMQQQRRQPSNTPSVPMLRQQAPSKIYQPPLGQQSGVTFQQGGMTIQPGMQQGGITTYQPGVRGAGGMDPQTIQAEIQQHIAEIQQIQAQMAALQQQDAQFVAQITNLQKQYQACTGNAQATVDAKLRERGTLAKEFENLDRQRTAPLDPSSTTTPEIDRLKKEDMSVKTYCDLPLDTRREELLDKFDCGAARDPQRPSGRGLNGPPTSIAEPEFPKSGMRPISAPLPATTQRSTSTSPLPAAPSQSPSPALNALTTPPARYPAPAPASPTPPTVMPAEPVLGPGSMPPGRGPRDSASELGLPPTSRRALPNTTPAPRPAAKVGDAAEVVVSNNFAEAVRLFGLAPGSDNEMLVRSMQPGEEAMIPSSIGTTFVVRPLRGGQEVQRHKVGKKLEILKLGGPGAPRE